MNLPNYRRADVIATVLDIRTVAEDTFWLELYADGITENAFPGQFVMIEVPGRFLRRPFSIAGVEGKRIKILLRTVGEGTRILARVRRNYRLRVLGPLGNGFPKIGTPPMLIAGGVGLAPMLFAKSVWKDAPLLYGEKDEKYLVDRTILPADTLIAVEESEKANKFRGTVVELAERQSPRPIFACGPAPMLDALAQLAEKWRVPAWFSLESRMACGFGVCNGCVIRTAEGYKKVCTDGPVFECGLVKDYLLEDYGI